MAWDLEDWEFMAVDPTVLELFPCSRQDTVSWAQVTLLSVNPTICSQEGNIAHPLLPLCPTWDQKNLPLPQTVPAHSQESVASPARGLEWRLPGETASEFHFRNMESQHLFLNTPQVPLPAPEPAGLQRQIHGYARPSWELCHSQEGGNWPMG